MYFESNEARKEYILKEAEKIRTAAGIIKDIKPIVRQFDGKVYNKRFCEAGEELEAFTDSKRIKAGAIIDKLNDKYGELMRKAYIFEEHARTLDQTMDQIDQLKMIYKKLWNDIPGELYEVYNIKRL